MALIYGMSVKEFWEDDPDLFWAYRFSYLTKIDTEQQLFNSNAWLQGMYFYEAVTVSLNNAFNKTKMKYAEEPYGTSEKLSTEEEWKKEQEKLVEQIKNRVSQVQALKQGELSKGEKRA